MRFEGLRETLLAGGIAPCYVRRYIAELSEHLDDLTVEQRAAGFNDADAAIRARARLGSDQELANAMLAHREFRSWIIRAPWAVFTLLPPLATLVMAFTLIAPLVLCAREAGVFTHGGTNAPVWFRNLAMIVVAIGNFAIAPSLATIFVIIATRQRMREIWPLLAILLIALVDLQLRTKFPATGHQGGTLSIGAGLWFSHFNDLREDWPLSVSQLLLTVLPTFGLLRKKPRSAD